MVPVTQAAMSVFGGNLSDTGTFSGPSTMQTLMAPASQVFPAGFDTSGVSAASAPFADLVTEALGQVDQLGQRAQAAVEGLISGTGVDVHEAMIATQKAGLGFELVLSVRNKALAAYQQVMGMQF
jgi:flagellar hook-basal body complex protein FliE